MSDWPPVRVWRVAVALVALAFFLPFWVLPGYLIELISGDAIITFVYFVLFAAIVTTTVALLVNELRGRRPLPWAAVALMFPLLPFAYYGVDTGDWVVLFHGLVALLVGGMFYFTDPAPSPAARRRR